MKFLELTVGCGGGGVVDDTHPLPYLSVSKHGLFSFVSSIRNSMYMHALVHCFCSLHCFFLSTQALKPLHATRIW